MTEQKYRLTVDTLKYEEAWTFDGTLKEIVEQLERVHGDQNDPLEWASEAGAGSPYPDCEDEETIPLSATEFPLTDWDIDAIADEVLGGHEEGYACRVSVDEFWNIVRKHDRTQQ